MFGEKPTHPDSFVHRGMKEKTKAPRRILYGAGFLRGGAASRRKDRLIAPSVLTFAAKYVIFDKEREAAALCPRRVLFNADTEVSI